MRSIRFHTHQVHFFVYRENGNLAQRPEWLDTVNLSLGGLVDLLMDFTDPIIRERSLFHCHLLKHEDKHDGEDPLRIAAKGEG
jgi:suppressor of ftsI